MPSREGCWEDFRNQPENERKNKTNSKHLNNQQIIDEIL